MTGEISSAKASARESARQANGKFGEQHLAEEIVGEGGVDLLDDRDFVDLNNFDWSDDEQVNGLVDLAYRSARGAARSTGCADRGYSVDDVAQAAVLKVLEGLDSDGKPKSRIENTGAFVTHMAHSAAVRAGRHVRSEDFAAYRVFNERRAAFRTEHGREITTGEEEALAKEIRDGWADQRHKPSEDFVLKVRGQERLADESVEVAMSTGQMQPLHAGTGTGSYVAPDSVLDHALSLVEDEENRDLRAARKAAWNVIAERTGAPMVTQPFLNHKVVTKTRAAFPKGTDLAPIADKWLDGGLDADSEKLLFAPWKDATDSQKIDIANALTEMPSYSYDLWNSALLAATPSR